MEATGTAPGEAEQPRRFERGLAVRMAKEMLDESPPKDARVETSPGLRSMKRPGLPPGVGPALNGSIGEAIRLPSLHKPGARFGGAFGPATDTRDAGPRSGGVWPWPQRRPAWPRTGPAASVGVREAPRRPVGAPRGGIGCPRESEAPGFEVPQSPGFCRNESGLVVFFIYEVLIASIGLPLPPESASRRIEPSETSSVCPFRAFGSHGMVGLTSQPRSRHYDSPSLPSRLPLCPRPRLRS